MRNRNAQPVLQVKGLTKKFGAVEALVDVDLEVYPHEVLALVGDNAAGKSTLAKLITGVLKPTSGSIHLQNERVELDSPAQAFHRGIATVFQELALCENLDVVSNIFLGRESKRGIVLNRDDMNARARKYLDSLNSRIPNLHAPVSSLSAGQRQCVAIARTLVGEPKLMVLDEPTASLSVVQTAEVLNHIEHLRDLGIGVVLISHSITDVRAVADRIEVLRHGRNNGSFDTRTSGFEEVLAAITGATRVNSPNR